VGGNYIQEGVFPGFSRKGKKEEFPGFMLFMQPGNSFPQICVVSVKEFGACDLMGTRVRKEQGFR